MSNPERSSGARARHLWLGIAACLVLSVPAQAQSAKELAMFESFLAIADSYIELVVNTHDVNADDGTAAVLQLQKMKEIFEDQGDVDGAISFFEGVLGKTSDRTVRNTTYMMLVDLLKDDGRFDDAEALMRKAIDESLSSLEGR